MGYRQLTHALRRTAGWPEPADKAMAEQLMAQWQQWPAERRGQVLFILWLNAVATLVLSGARSCWLAVTVVRVWTRRDRGLLVAVRDGACWKSLAVLVVVTGVHQIARGWCVRSLLADSGPSQPRA